MKLFDLRLNTFTLTIMFAILLTGCQGGGSEPSQSNGVAITPNDPGSDTALAQISWTIPATRILGDSLSLSEIQGYKLYYGTAPGNYSGSAEITGAQTTQATVTLDSGDTYYFVVRAVDTNGLEGPESNTVTRTL